MLNVTEPLSTQTDNTSGGDPGAVKTFDPAVDRSSAEQSTLWEVRTEEQPYAFLSDHNSAEKKSLRTNHRPGGPDRTARRTLTPHQ